MKKLLIAAVAAVAFVGSAFALDFQVDAGIGLPISVITNSYTSSDSTDLGSLGSSSYSYSYDNKYSTVAFGLNAGFEVYFTDLLGASLKLDMGFPGKMKNTSSGSVTTTITLSGKTTSNTENYDPETTTADGSGLATTIFLGLAIRPLNGKFFLVATPGIDLAFLSFKNTENSITNKLNVSSFGIGADIQAGYKITDMIAISGGVFMSFNFSPKFKSTTSYNGKSVTSEPDYDSSFEFLITPKIGASIFF